MGGAYTLRRDCWPLGLVLALCSFAPTLVSSQSCPEMTAEQLGVGAFIATMSGNCESEQTCRLACRCGYQMNSSSVPEATCNSMTNTWDPSLPKIICDLDPNMQPPRTIHVSPLGNDTQSGTAEAPLRTIRKAVSKISPSACGADTIQLSEGKFESPFLYFGAEFQFKGWYEEDTNVYQGMIPDMIPGDVMWSSAWHLHVPESEGIVQDVSADVDSVYSFVEDESNSPNNQNDPNSKNSYRDPRSGRASCVLSQESGPAPYQFVNTGFIVSVRNRYMTSMGSSHSAGAVITANHASSTIAVFLSEAIELDQHDGFMMPTPYEFSPKYGFLPVVASGSAAENYSPEEAYIAVLHESSNNIDWSRHDLQRTEHYLDRSMVVMKGSTKVTGKIKALHASVVSLVLFTNGLPANVKKGDRVKQVEGSDLTKNFSGVLLNENADTSMQGVLHIAVDNWASPFELSNCPNCTDCSEPLDGVNYPKINITTEDGSTVTHKVCDVRIQFELNDKFRGGQTAPQATISCGSNPERYFHRNVNINRAAQERAEVVSVDESTIPNPLPAYGFEINGTWRKKYTLKAISGGLFNSDTIESYLQGRDYKPNLYFMSNGNCIVRAKAVAGSVLAVRYDDWNGQHFAWSSSAPFKLVGIAGATVITSHGLKDAPGIHIRTDPEQLLRVSDRGEASWAMHNKTFGAFASSMIPHGQNLNSTFRISNIAIDGAAPGVLLDGLGTVGLLENVEIRNCSNAASKLGAAQLEQSRHIWPSGSGSGIIFRCEHGAASNSNNRCSSLAYTFPEDYVSTLIKNVTIVNSHATGNGAGISLLNVMPKLVNIKISHCSASYGFGVPASFDNDYSIGGGIYIDIQEVNFATSESEEAHHRTDRYATRGALVVWENIEVTHNAAVTGGGLGYFTGDPRITIDLQSSSISDNMAIFGGGIYQHLSAVALSHGSRVERNMCASEGCGLSLLKTSIFSSGGGSVSGNLCGPVPRLFGQDRNSVHFGNRKDINCRGAGFFLVGSSISLHGGGNLIVANNSATCVSCHAELDDISTSSIHDFSGGGIYLDRSTLTGSNLNSMLLIAGNTAWFRGAGILSYDSIFVVNERVSRAMMGNTVDFGRNDALLYGEGLLGSITNSSTQGVDLYSVGSVGPLLSCDPGSKAWNPNATFWSARGGKFCLACPPGQFQNAPGQSICVECPPGRFQNDSASTSCKTCPAGYFCPLGTDQPFECIQGSNLISTQRHAAVYCLEGYGSPIPVAPGFQGSSDSVGGTNRTFTSIVQVSPGYYSASGIATQCQPGFEASISGLSQCSPCSAGRFADSKATIFCTSCPPGRFSSMSGSTKCFACPTGYYSPSSAFSQCLMCNPGKFASQNVSQSCEECPIAKYSSVLGSSGCQFCEEGHYAPTRGSPACLACLAGRRGRGTAANRSECDLCSPGRYSDAFPRLNCKLCGVGTYSPASSATLCQMCGAGQFSNRNGSSACTDCPANTYAELSGQRSCKSCPDNTESSKGSRGCVQVIKYTLSLQLSLEIPSGAPKPPCERIANFSAELAGVDQNDVVLKTEGCPSTPGARTADEVGTNGRRLDITAGRLLSGTGAQVYAWECSISAQSSSQADEISLTLENVLNSSQTTAFQFVDTNTGLMQYPIHSISSVKEGALIIGSSTLISVTPSRTHPSTSATVSWTHIPYVVKYEVYASTRKNLVMDQQTKYEISVNTSDSPLIGDHLSIECSNLAPAGHTFYFRVVGVGANNAIGQFSAWSEKFILASPPGALVNMRVSRGSGKEGAIARVDVSIMLSNGLATHAFLQQRLEVSYTPVPKEETDASSNSIHTEYNDASSQNAHYYSISFSDNEIEVSRFNLQQSDIGQVMQASFEVSMHAGTTLYPYIFTASLYSPALDSRSDNVSTVAFAHCTEGTFRSTHRPLFAQSCEICPENAYCHEGSNASTIVPKAGYWRVGWHNNNTGNSGDLDSNPLSLVFVPCPYPAACCGALVSQTSIESWLDTSTSSVNEPGSWCINGHEPTSNASSQTIIHLEEGCAPGHYGVGCAQCRVGQALSASGKCLPCATLSEHTTSIVGVAFLYFIFFSVSLVFACRTNFRLARTFQDSDLVKAKVMVDHWQSMVESRRKDKVVSNDEKNPHSERNKSILSHLHLPFHHHLQSPLRSRPEKIKLSTSIKGISDTVSKETASASKTHATAPSAKLDISTSSMNYKEAETNSLSTKASTHHRKRPSKRHSKRHSGAGRKFSVSALGLLHIPPQEVAPDLDEVAYNARSLLILSPDSMPGGLAVAKIFMTHFSVLSLAGSFNVDWRTPSEWFILNIDFFSSVSREVFDITCLQVDDNAPPWRIRPHLIQFLVLLAIPMLTILCIALPWACLTGHLVRTHFQEEKENHPDKKSRPQNVASSLNTVIVLVIGIGITCFFWHPTITKATFAQFSCVPISNRAFLAEDFGVECWPDSNSVMYGDTDNMIHNIFIYAVTLPSVIIYILGIPLIASLVLWRRRAQLTSWNTLMMFGALYDGTKPKAYFWEVMAIPIRRVFLAFVVIWSSQIARGANALAMSTPKGDITMLLSVSVVIIARFHLLSVKPYIPTLQTEIEAHALAVEAITFFCALFIFSPNVSEPIKRFVSVFVFCTNVAFFLLVFWVLVWLRRSWVLRSMKHQVRVAHRLYHKICRGRKKKKKMEMEKPAEPKLLKKYSNEMNDGAKVENGVESGVELLSVNQALAQNPMHVALESASHASSSAVESGKDEVSIEI